MPDVHFQVDLFGERISLSTFSDVVKKLDEVLRGVQRGLLPDKTPAHWFFEAAASLPVQAASNGTSEAELQTVLRTVWEGFDAAHQAAGGDIAWPQSLDGPERRSILGILQSLSDSVDSITVSGDGVEPISLEEPIANSRSAKDFYVAWSTIDGVIETVSVRGRPLFKVRQHWSGRVATGFFDLDMLDEVTVAINKRVVVEGLVRYRDDGSPASISDIRHLWHAEESSGDILDFEGAIPNLTGGLAAEDYVRRLRDGENE